MRQIISEAQDSCTIFLLILIFSILILISIPVLSKYNLGFVSHMVNTWNMLIKIILWSSSIISAILLIAYLSPNNQNQICI
jgi:hypothetical protein